MLREKLKISFLNLKNFSILLLAFSFTNVAIANPILNNVAHGDVSISNTPNTTVVTASDHAIINWNSFDIAAGEKTQFVQPNASSVALNRVVGSNSPSQIYGTLTANGKIILVNGAGIYFGPSALVNVGGLIASTTDISDSNFLNNQFIFDKPGSNASSVTNDGSIVSAKYGLVALVGNNVVNNGMIKARLGSIVLASGAKFTFDFNGDQLINFSVDGTSSGQVSNNGKLLANGGQVILSARQAQGVLDNSINMKGVVVANSVRKRHGVIILDGGNGKVAISGKLIARGRHQNSKGGKIKVVGNQILLSSTAVLNTSGMGGGGSILIGGKGSDHDAASTQVDSGAVLKADAIESGNGGDIIVWSRHSTHFHGFASAQGGSLSGDGGFVETSGHYLNIENAQINLLAPHGKTGEWLLDPTDIYIANDQTNATNAGMITQDTSAGTLSSQTFSATGSTQDSLITVSQLVSALASANITVSTANASGTGTGNIFVVDPITWTNANSLSLTATNNININNAISGTTGTLQLSAASTLNSITRGASGSIAVANLKVNQGSFTTTSSTPALTVTGTTTIESGAQWLLGASFTNSGSLALKGSGLSGAGALVATATATYTGGISTAAAATIGNSAGTFTIASGITNNNGLTLNPTGTLTLSTISGSGSVTVSGGTVNLNAGNTINNSIILNGGNTNLNSSGGLGGSGILQVNTGSTFTFGNFTMFLGSRNIRLNGGTVGGSGIQNITGNSGNFVLDAASNIKGSIALNTPITGTGTLNAIGGTVFLNNVGSWTGGTNVSGGATLVLGFAGQNGTLGTPAAGNTNFITVESGSAWTISGGAPAITVTIPAGKFATISGTGSGAGAINPANAAGVTINGPGSIVVVGSAQMGPNNSPYTINAPITGSGTLTLTNFNSKAISVNGTNTISNLIVSSVATFGSANAFGQSFTANATITATNGVNANNLSGGGTINIGANQSVILNPTINTTYSGSLSGTGTTSLQIQSIGGGIQTLTGNSTLPGGVTIDALASLNLGGNLTSNITSNGNLNVTNTIALTGNLTGSGALTISAGRIFTINPTGTAQFDGTVNGGILAVGGSAGSSLVLTTANVNTTGLTVNANGTLTVNGIFNNGAIIANGTLNSLNTNAITDLNGSGILNVSTTGLTISPTAADTFSGVIAGTTLTIGGTSGSSISLTGNNTYTGNTTINANANLKLSNAPVNSTIINNGTFSPLASMTINDYSGTGNIAIAAGSTLTLNSAVDLSIPGIISGNSISFAGAGINYTLSGINTFTGVATVNSGTTLKVTGRIVSALAVDGTAILQNTMTIKDLTGAGTANFTTGTVTVTPPNNTDVFAGSLTGAAGLAIAGGASTSLTLSGTSNFSGPLTINSGATLNVSGVLGSNAIVTNSGTLNLQNNITLASITGAGALKINSNTLTLGLANNATYSGVISGNGNLTINSSAFSLSLSGSNTFSGLVSIANGGTLSVSNPLPAAINNNGTFNVNTNLSITDLTGSGNTIIAATRGLTVTPTGNAIYTGIISGNVLTVAGGAGTSLILNGSNTNTGGTTINANATLTVGGSFSGTLNNSGTFNLNAPQTISTLIGSGTINVGSNTLTINNSGSSTFSGIITGSNLVLGTGTLLLTGPNTLSGTATINSGATLNVSGTLPAAIIANGTLGAQQNLSILDLSGSGAVSVSSTKVLTINPLANLTFGGVISGTGGIAIGGNTGTSTTFTGNNTYTGGTTINNNASLIMSGLPTASALTNNGNLTIANTLTFTTLNGTGNVVINPTRTLTVSGGGTLSGVVSGNNLTVSGGTLSLTGLNNLTGTITVNSGATLNFKNNLGALANNGTTVLQSAVTSQGLSGTGNLNFNGNSLTLNPISNLGYSGVMSGTGSLTINGAAGSSLTLSGVNTFSGSVSISNGATLSVSNVLPATITNNGTFNVQNTMSILGLSGTGSTSITTAKILTVSPTGNTTFDGVISGAGALTLGGSAGTRLTLGGTNTYTGATTINANATLNVTGALGSTALSNSGTLNLSGTTNLTTLNGAGGINITGSGVLLVNSGGTYSGVINGNALTVGGGTLTLSALNTINGIITINSGATLNVSTGLGSGGVVANGTFNSQNNFTIGDLSGNGSVAISALKTLTINPIANQTFSGVISGSGNLIIDGSAGGSVGLSGTNTFTGTTTINSNAALNLSKALVSQIQNDGNLNITASLTLNNILGSGNTTINASRILTLNNSSGITINNTLLGSGSLQKTGSGVLTLTGANNLNGSFNVLAGGVTLQTNDSQYNSIVIASGAGLNVNGVTVTAPSLLITGNGLLSAGAIVASGSSKLVGDISLLGNSVLTAQNASTLEVDGNVDGGQALTLQGAGNFIFDKPLGQTTALSNLIVSADSTFSGGSITTSGDQQFNNPIIITGAMQFNAQGNVIVNNSVNADNDVTFSAANINLNNATVSNPNAQTYNGNINLLNNATLNANAITIGNGVTGNTKNLVLNGIGGNSQFTLSGELAVNNLTVNGNSNSTLSVATTDANPSWNIISSNSGTLTGLTELQGNFAFNNVENLIGGFNGNQFIFNPGSSLSGTITGSGITSSNTIDLTNYGALTNLNLSAINDGTLPTTNNALIASFVNIGTVNGNNTGKITINIPNLENTLHITAAGTGYIDDPIYFSGFNNFEAANGILVKAFFETAFRKVQGNYFVNNIKVTFTNIAIQGDINNEDEVISNLSNNGNSATAKELLDSPNVIQQTTSSVVQSAVNLTESSKLIPTTLKAPAIHCENTVVESSGYQYSLINSSNSGFAIQPGSPLVVHQACN